MTPPVTSGRTTAAVFAQGWHDTALGVAPDTASKVGTQYPDLTPDEISVYLNGAEDGARGDQWRLDDAPEGEDHAS